MYSSFLSLSVVSVNILHWRNIRKIINNLRHQKTSLEDGVPTGLFDLENIICHRSDSLRSYKSLPSFTSDMSKF